MIDVGGTVTVYDTLDHQIGGFSQQQSVGGTLSFNSQHGLIDVASLPVISSNGQPPPRAASSTHHADQTQAAAWGSSPAPAASASGSVNEQDVFATIEKLAGLKAKGILSDEEFQAKKAELLGRL